MSDKKPEKGSAEDIMQAISQLRGGVEHKIIVEDKEVGVIQIREVTLGQIERFSEIIARILPALTNALASGINKKIQSGELPDNEEELSKIDIMQAMGGQEMLSQVLPVFLRYASQMIDDTCEPPGLVRQLPHDVAAPIVAKWIKLNVLTEAKIQAWTTAFEGMVEQAKKSETLKNLITEEGSPDSE